MIFGIKGPVADEGSLSSIRARSVTQAPPRVRIEVNLDPEDSSGEDTDRPCGDDQDNIVLDEHADGKQSTGSTTKLVIEQSESEMEVTVESFSEDAHESILHDENPSRGSGSFRLSQNSSPAHPYPHCLYVWLEGII